jgi:beta-glucosidase
MQKKHPRVYVTKTAMALAVSLVAATTSFWAQAAAPGGGAPAAGTSTIGAYPAGPGGRNAPMAATPRPDPLPPFYDPKLPVAKRVENVVSLLSLPEKVVLMQMASPSIPRLGIAPYHWWTEALHGMTHDLSTVFPQAIGLSATWDTDLHYKVATAISTEGRAKNAEYRSKNVYDSMTGLDFWSPNVNIFRDPRWGRGQETYGEDPYLSSRFGIAFVKGIQGDDPVYFRAIATPKHFAVHSGPEATRHSFNAVVTDEDLYTTYLPQFEATIKEAHAHSVMSSYNAINGVPNSANKRLLTDILRTQWGFDGYVVGDDGSVAGVFNAHRYLPDGIQTSAAAVKAGNDLDSGTTFAGGGGGGRRGGGGAAAVPNLLQAVQQGLITEKEVDVSLGRIMEARIRMGEFDPPGYAGNPYNKIAMDMYNTPENHELALKAARETMVLLKNANHTLPWKADIGTVAVMGPNCNNIVMQYGNYNGKATPEHQVTILDGIKKVVGADHVLTLQTPAPIAGNAANEALNAEATEVTKKADAIVVVVGISGQQEGEQRDRNAIELPAVQESLIQAVMAAAGKKPVVVVDCSGSAIALNWANDNVPAVIQAWYPGQRGDAVADVLFGKYNPAGRLPVTFYKATTDLPAFTDYNMYNRTYRYNTQPVLYPFGYGLSYSTFEYSGLSAPAKSSTGDDVKVSCTVKNTSAVDGDEVVQLYINRDLPAVDSTNLPTPDKMTDEQATALATPRKALVGFARVPLKAGESKKVTFTVTTQQLSLVVGKDGKREVRPGNVQIQMGGNSVAGTGTLTQALSLEGAAKAPGYHFVAPTVQ